MHAELVGHLRATGDGHERPGGIVAEAQEHLDLLGQQAAGGRRQELGGPTIEACERCDAPKASLTYRSWPAISSFDERRVVGLLARVEAQVLQQLDARRQLGQTSPDGRDGVLRDRVRPWAARGACTP